MSLQRAPRVTANKITPKTLGKKPLLLQQTIGDSGLPKKNLNLLTKILDKSQKSYTENLKERNDFLVKDFKRREDLPNLVLKGSRISVYSYEEMKKIKVCEITDTSETGSGSLYDERMGSSNANVRCGYCSSYDCPGHYGIIDFGGVKIPHPLFIREIQYVLHIICGKCGCLLLNKEVMKEKGYLSLKGSKRLRVLEAECKKLPCTNKDSRMESIDKGSLRCGHNPNYEVNKETGIFRFSQSRKSKNSIEFSEDDNIMQIDDIYKIFDSITNEDSLAMGFDRGTHPRDFILQGILVCPNVARVKSEQKFSALSDKQTLTPAYKAILSKIKEIKNKSGMTKTKNLESELFKSISAIISLKEEDTKIKKSESMSVNKLIQGKEGLIRLHMVGKRNNYAARTVSGPDPEIRFGQIRIPEIWAEIQTKIVKVADYNFNHLNKLLREGKIEAIYTPQEVKRIVYKNKLNEYRIRIGDSVERHLENGDFVSVNRQPNLSKYSMIGVEVILGKQLTIGLHLSYTTPLNADFDGDENNIWLPRDIETDVETQMIHNSKQNIIHRGGCRPSMAYVINSVLGSYLLSQPDIIIKENLFRELMELLNNLESIPTLFDRLKKFNIHPRSGRALISALLPEDFYYIKRDKNNVVRIINGIFVTGELTKKTVGVVPRSIIQELWRDCDHEYVIDFLSEGPRIINRWLIEYGFTIGIGDCYKMEVDENGNEYNVNDRRVREISKEVINKVQALGGKLSDEMEESYRERQISELVNVATAKSAEQIAKDIMTPKNPLRLMSNMGSGSKGAYFNIMQIACIIGQQNYKGKRLQPTVDKNRRLLPCFDRNDTNPEAYGFIPRSYSNGLNTEQLFFLQASGREGIIDTALNTAKTGELNREMVKTLENIVIYSDGSMRSTCGDLYFPVFNGGYDIGECINATRRDNTMEEKYITIIDLDKVQTMLNYKRGFVEKDLAVVIQNNFGKDTYDNKLNIPIIEKAKKYTPRIKKPENLKRTRLNIYERARIIGTRAIQIENNAPILIMTNSVNAIDIAREEYYAGKLSDFFVCRNSAYKLEKIYATIDNI